MRDNETTAKTLVGKIRLEGALAGKEEQLHSWVQRSNHELDGQQQQQVNLVPTAVYSNFVYNPRCKHQYNLLINVNFDVIVEHNKYGGLNTICTSVYC